MSEVSKPKLKEPDRNLFHQLIDLYEKSERELLRPFVSLTNELGIKIPQLEEFDSYRLAMKNMRSQMRNKNMNVNNLPVGLSYQDLQEKWNESPEVR